MSNDAPPPVPPKSSEHDRAKTTIDSSGRFNRPPSTFRSFISPDGPFTPEAGRYHLYVAYACPWAHRALIARKLKGLEDIVGLSITSPNWGENGWPFPPFDPYPGSIPDTINSANHVKDLYLLAEPTYTGRFSIPVLWDTKLDTIVNNESAEILRIFNEGFDGILEAAAGSGEKAREKLDLYPEKLRNEIDEMNEWVYEGINNGIYKVGFAKTQEAYDESIGPLFDALDRVEKLLTEREERAKNDSEIYLVGDRLTEADIRLYTTIIRFDPVYVGHFKCNIRDIRHGYPHINRWLKNLYWNHPAFKETTNFDHIKRNYYHAMTSVNPNGIIPKGPVPDIQEL